MGNEKEKDVLYNKLQRHISDATQQSSYVLLGKIFGLVFGFLVSTILAKYYGSKIMGQYTIVKTIVNIAVIFTVFGLDNGIVKYVSRFRTLNKKEKYLNIIKTSLILATIFSVLISMLIFYFRSLIANNIFNDSELINSISYGAWIIIPLTFIKIFGGIYRAFKNLKYYIISNEIIRRAGLLILLIILYFLNIKSSVYVILSILAIYIIVFIYLSFNVKNISLNIFNVVFSKNFFPDKKLTKELLSYSSTLIFISFMLYILSKIDKLMLGYFTSSSIVGIYSIATLLATLVTFVLSSSNMIFSSIVSELFSQNNIDLLNKIYSLITKWLIILTLPIALNMIIFPKVILSFFGSEYIIASTTLIILVISQMINVFVGGNGQILSMCGYENILLINNSLMVIINILLNIILIPNYGMLGAAIATGVSIASINLIKVIQLKYYLNIFPYNRNYFFIILLITMIVINSFLFKLIYNHLFIVVLTTIINYIISLFLIHKYSTDMDLIIFKAIKENLLLRS